MGYRAFPYKDGDVTVLGPEIIVSDDGQTISWRGENFYTLGRARDVEARAECAVNGHVWEIIQEVGKDGPSEVMCTRCTTARLVLSLDDSHKHTAMRAAALDLIEACAITGYPEVPTPVANAIKRICDLARRR